MKHWRYFEKTRDFLRQRYSEHGILAGPALTFDCLVPKFQKPLDIPPEKRKQYKLPRRVDPPEWYAKATILQQSETEILRMALLSLVGAFRRRKMKSRVVMILHDAIWAEATEEETEETRRLLEHAMKNAVNMPCVPLEVEFE